MRYLLISLAAAALFAGCMHYPYARQPRQAGPAQAPAMDAQVPPGKMLVQDLRTGNLILIDDPNWNGAMDQPEPAPEPAPRPSVSVPLPRLPSPRALPRPRIHVPPVPELPAPGLLPAKKQPQFEISLKAFAFDISGTVYGHDDTPFYSADMYGDLGIEDGAGVSLNLALILPKGAKFRVGLSALMAEGREMEPYYYGDPYFVAEIDVTIIDLAFTPLAYYGNWGGLSMETGVRYARSNVAVIDSSRHAEGVMVLVGGELCFNLYHDVLAGTVAGSLGLGADSFSIEFETGLKLKASPHFHFSLTYRLMAMSLEDSGGEPDERSLAFGAAGPALEMGLKF